MVFGCLRAICYRFQVLIVMKKVNKNVLLFSCSVFTFNFALIVVTLVNLMMQDLRSSSGK